MIKLISLYDSEGIHLVGRFQHDKYTMTCVTGAQTRHVVKL